MARARNSIWRGARIQLQNVRSILLRDLMMRFGRDNIGFAWIILEPLLLTVGVMIVWSFTMGTSRHGVKIVEFILTGYMPLTLWRHMTNGPIMLFRRSAPLLYHRTITLFDILTARQVLEFAGTTAALLFVWGALYSAGIISEVARLDLLLVGWLMMTWLAFGVGAIIAAVTERSDAAERFIQPIQYVAIPLSGAFFMVDWLPSWSQQAVLLNPLVHCYEVFRAGYFGEAVTTHYNFGYFAIWALAFSFVGIVGVQKARAWVQVQ